MNLDDPPQMSSSRDSDVVRTRQELRSLAERLLVIRAPRSARHCGRARNASLNIFNCANGPMRVRNWPLAIVVLATSLIGLTHRGFGRARGRGWAVSDSSTGPPVGC